MAIALLQEKMPEAEVSLRLAFFLLGLPNSGKSATVAIDGAQIRVHGTNVFPIGDFLELEGWSQVKQQGRNSWQGIFRNGDSNLIVESKSGIGDVVVKVGSQRVRAESKKGPLVKKKGSPEYPLVREAIGQLMTIETVADRDILAVAVPLTEQFRRLAERWRHRPLIAAAGIRIVLVGRDGTVEGLPVFAAT